MHKKVLPKGSRKLLGSLEACKDQRLAGWILAGGTGLALQFGHRISEDFDFFRTDDLDLRELHPLLNNMVAYETLQDAEHTLTIIADDVKMSFFRVRDPFLYERIPYRFFALADPRDVALMKTAAIANRGARKDFVDLYTILRNGPTLREVFDDLPRKYGTERINTYHILKSLTYFEDAEEEPMPRMLEPFDWKECKDFFVREAQAIILPP